jgi:thiol-disulfide isomerase/thioredoxin
MKIYRFVIFLFLVISGMCLALNAFSNVVLYNSSAKELQFHYQDEFLEIVQIKIASKTSKSISMERPFCLIQSNLYQNIYLLYPFDSVRIYLAANGNAVFTISNDTIRTNELFSFVYVNERVSLKFVDMRKLEGDLLDSNYRYDYMEKIKFVELYKRHRPISLEYEENIKKYYLISLYAKQIYLGNQSLRPLSIKYRQYLENLSDSVFKIVSDKMPFDIQSRFLVQYFKFLGKNYLGTNNYYRILFEYARSRTPLFLRDEVSFIVVKEMLTHDGPANFPLIDSFLNNCNTLEFRNYIQDMLLGVKLSGEGNKDIFVHSNGKSYSFDDLLKVAKGKVIYIDVWASWCAPCIGEMPAEEHLQNIYASKPVEFIYISIDENKGAWGVANKKHGLDKKKGSYLLLNPGRSEFSKIFKTGTIPRYILIDKNGTVFNADAPRPSSVSIRSMIDLLILK